MITIAELLSEKQKLKEAEKLYKNRKKRIENKNYLSQHDREEIIVLAAIGSKLEELIELWLKHGRSRKRIKYGKTALTYIFKALDNYFECFNEEDRIREVRRTIRDLERYELKIDRKW